MRVLPKGRGQGVRRRREAARAGMLKPEQEAEEAAHAANAA